MLVCSNQIFEIIFDGYFFWTQCLNSFNKFMIRINAGLAWAGQVVKTYRDSAGNEYKVIKNPRPFRGVQEGISDMLGFEVVEITAEMVGQKVAVFTAEEVKVTGRLTKAQKSFGEFVQAHGGIFRVIK